MYEIFCSSKLYFILEAWVKLALLLISFATSALDEQAHCPGLGDEPSGSMEQGTKLGSDDASYFQLVNLQ